jgi:ribosomal protein L11 methyltransferase
VQVARENAELNQVELELSDSALGELQGHFDLVVANIMAVTLQELAGPLVARAAQGGELLLSGILDFQGDEVAAAFTALGCRVRGRRQRDEWVLLHLDAP